jgi:hypothetical protein
MAIFIKTFRKNILIKASTFSVEHCHNCIDQETRMIGHHQYGAILWDSDSLYGWVLDPTDREQILINAVNVLPTIPRKIVVLFTLAEMQRYEIALYLNLSISTVRLLVYQSGLQIRRYLNQQNAISNYDNIFDLIFVNWPWIEYAEIKQFRTKLIIWIRPQIEIVHSLKEYCYAKN